MYDLTLKQGESEFLPGKSAATCGVNSSYLGPTLRVHNGDRVRMKFANNPEVKADARAVDIGQHPFLTIVMVFCPSAKGHFKRVLHAARTRLH